MIFQVELITGYMVPLKPEVILLDIWLDRNTPQSSKELIVILLMAAKQLIA